MLFALKPGLTVQVRKLMARRLDPGWNFSTLYLIKDSLAIMLEAAGLLEDAFREYFELEACYLEALEQGGNLAGRQFGQLSQYSNCTVLQKVWRFYGLLCLASTVHTNMFSIML